MEILTSMRRLYISFKSLVNDFVYSFGRAALLLLVEVQNHAVPVRERRRIRVNLVSIQCAQYNITATAYKTVRTGTKLLTIIKSLKNTLLTV